MQPPSKHPDVETRRSSPASGTTRTQTPVHARGTHTHLWQEHACQAIGAFMAGRKGRLFEFPPLPRPAVLVEGYQTPARPR